MTLELATASASAVSHRGDRGGVATAINRGRRPEDADAVTNMQERSKDVAGV